MSVNLSALANLANTASNLTNFILVSPTDVEGIQATVANGGTQPDEFLFNYEGENSVSLESDITDHYIEDNTSIQDQIALKPVIITTQGYICELNDIVPPLLKPIKFAADALYIASAYTPAISATALLALAEAQYAYSIATKAAESVINGVGSTVFGVTTQTKQQIAYVKFYNWWQNRVLFIVKTPWGAFPNCAIRTLRAVQDPDTKQITDFEITFKVMRFASTKSRNAPPNKQGHLQSQSAGLNKKGNTPTADNVFFDKSKFAGAKSV